MKKRPTEICARCGGTWKNDRLEMNEEFNPGGQETLMYPLKSDPLEGLQWREEKEMFKGRYNARCSAVVISNDLLRKEEDIHNLQ